MLEFFKGSRTSSMEEVEKTMVEMLRNGRAVYDAAMAAVFGGGSSPEAKREVKGTDRRINRAEQEVRRALIMHTSVVGLDALDIPDVLKYMSVVKDIERVGDYAKNVYDIAKYGADFSTAPDVEQLAGYRDAVGSLIDDAAAVFESHDSARAEELIAKADRFLDDYDDHVQAAAHSHGSAFDAVNRALYYRYLKRITAHLMNLMTALALPVDQLDYYDEDKDDRA